MKICLAQINPIVGAVEANASLMAGIMGGHADCDLVVFPELSLTGYPPEDLSVKPAFLDAVEENVAKLVAGQAKGKPAILVSAPWRVAGGVANALLLIDGGMIAQIIPKHHLPNYGVFDEKRVFIAGALPDPVLFRGRKIGFMTCEDLWFPDVAAHLKAGGAEILIIPNASPYDVTKPNQRMDIAKARVAETGLPLLYLNQVGGQDELVFDGASFGLGKGGALAFRLKSFEVDEIVITFEDTIERGVMAPLRDEIESVYEALKCGLRDYVLKNGFSGVLIGLSGGIDSALVAVIAAEALGPDKVSCIMMPSPYTAQMSLDDAKQLAKNLGCAYREIPIHDGMRAFDTMLKEDAHIGVTPENIQSRLRGMMLMALSNAGGQMVVSTGNKSEMAVGYATLYGDMCGGFAVLKDVYKTQVFALCRWINARRGKPLIPERIITRPPSAELKADQTDQDTLPPYDVLDRILEGLIERDARRRELVAEGFDAATVMRVATMLDRAEYKRRQAPPGPKITTRAFGRERRVPITNGFKPVPLENLKGKI